MGTSLSGLTPATTFDGLLKTSDNDGLSTTKKTVGTGDGVDSQLKLATNSTTIGNIEFVSANVIATISPSTNLRITTGGVGINGDYSNPASSTKLHIKGSGTTSATTSLLVQNSAGDDILKATDDRVVSASIFSSTISRLSYINTITNSYTVMQSHLGDGNASFYNSVAVGQTTTPTARLHVKGSGNDNTTTSLLVQNSDGDELAKVDDSGNISAISSSIGHTAQVPYIRSYIKGIGATSATSSLLVQNSAGAQLLKVEDGGKVVLSNDDLFASGQLIKRGSTFIQFGAAALEYGVTSSHIFKVSDGTNISEVMRITGTDQNVGIGEITPTAKLHIASDEQGLKIRAGSTSSHNILDIADASGSKGLLYRAGDGVIQFYGQTFNLESQSSNGNIRLNSGSASGGVGINVTPAAFTRMHIKGLGTTSATTALLVQNSAGTDLLKVQDNGEVVVPTTLKASSFNVQLGRIYPFSQDGDLGWNASTSYHFRNIYSKGVTHITDNAASSTTLDASAKLQVDSTTQGFLPPRMTTTERDAITTPAAGLMVYNTDTNTAECWNGSSWMPMF